ncbi:MAG: hypothetical protein ACUBOA_11670 [Candidatus Loosdrechtia sp.]|uniref:hypothetical protein n=1 Tax=Candidatus Loosdrechtia sp. TaxID=3101272 RepID=UPI003A759C06|nr:MAG: hypothetical protein QY305_00475 [Candidatus Jettenia sp. AMX2]
MKRIHFFELEDKRWFPATFRNLLTDSLQFGITAFQLYEPIIPLLKKVLQHMNTTQIVDLCSGASGPWTYLQLVTMQEQGAITVTLTDKYPNLHAFERISKLSKGQIHYLREPVDAAKVPEDIKGVRTIFTGFHHFRPELAKAILQNAVDQRVAICIFEFTERRLQNLLLTPIITPLTIFLTTPFMKPITFSRIFWTYFIPVVPLAISWDSIISNLRTYSIKELRELTSAVKGDGYTWEIGKTISTKVKAINITYLLGYPGNPLHLTSEKEATY